jgi:uncharacterized protein YaiI (UPF0178 family)
MGWLLGRLRGPKRSAPFTESNIGDALATRNLLSEMRGAGMVAGGPPPFHAQDRSRYLQALDRTIHALRRRPARSDAS